MTTPDTSPPLSDEKLSDAERRLVDAVITGTLVDLRVSATELDDPGQAAAWGPDRNIRAELLAELLTGIRTPQGGPVRAVKLRGARITGPLDMEARQLACPLLLQDCHIEQAVNLSEATASVIRLPGCHLPALTARQLRTTGDVQLDDGFTARGEVNLAGAHIGGQLSLNGASLEIENGTALAAEQLTVDQGMFCRAGFTARGEVRLIGAHIGGQLDLTGASLGNENGPALNADGLTVDQGMFCRTGFTARGEVNLDGAHIGGQLSLNGASLENENGTALTADGLTVDQGMFCSTGFSARGEVRLPGAHIAGQLDLTGASLENENGMALTADGLTVDQGMFCSTGFTARGEVRLPGAHIAGQLDLTGASLENENDTALTAEQLTVNQGMICRAGFTARGEVRLIGAHIAGQLDLTGASLENENDTALDAEQLTVNGSMFCRAGFSARGQVRLDGAHIAGQLDLTGASLGNENGPALYAEQLTVDETMACGEGFSARGEVNLVNAKVGGFFDDPASWPVTMRLRGFTYDILENDQVSVRQRLRWLTRNADGYVPQIYDQLATAYRNAGHEEAARRVAIAKQRRRRSALNPLSWLWYATVGYGYRTWLAGAWLGAFLAVGTWVFSRAHMISTGTHPPAFHSFAYTADVIMPVVNLGQKSAWQPQGSALYWSWALTGAGWVLTTAVVAGLAGVLKRD